MNSKFCFLALIGMVSVNPLFGGDLSGVNESANRPNIVIILADDLGIGDVSCYNENAAWETPNIDQLASRGVLFSKAYCQAPHCAPSRSSLLSGVHTRNYNGIPMKPEELAPGKTTLPATFRRAGYYTIGNGKIYHQQEDDAEQN